MNIRRRVSGIAAGVALAGTLFTPLAGADTQTESHPETCLLYTSPSPRDS